MKMQLNQSFKLSDEFGNTINMSPLIKLAIEKLKLVNSLESEDAEHNEIYHGMWLDGVQDLGENRITLSFHYDYVETQLKSKKK